MIFSQPYGRWKTRKMKCIVDEALAWPGAKERMVNDVFQIIFVFGIKNKKRS